MSSPSKPIVLYSHTTGPNPKKVAILLEELNIPYRLVSKEIGDGPNGVKEPVFLENVTLNGRVPAIDDNGFLLWESGAILTYLAEKYAPDGTWHGRTLEERAIVNQWLAFQLSGLGPMLGQVFFFTFFHEKISGKAASQDTIDRFTNETIRILGVLEAQLTRQEAKGYEFIALDRITIADLAFTAWLNGLGRASIDVTPFPKVVAYQARIQEREKTKKAWARVTAGGTDSE
jgi:glutathione S-transferase